MSRPLHPSAPVFQSASYWVLIITSAIFLFLLPVKFLIPTKLATIETKNVEILVDNSSMHEVLTPKRLDFMCCGIGHRLSALSCAARDLKNATPFAIHWGPCHNISTNVFGSIFKPQSMFIPFQPSEGDLPFPQQNEYFNEKNLVIPEDVQRALGDMLINHLADDYMKVVIDFKQRNEWDRVPVIALHIRTGNTFNKKYDKESSQILSRTGGLLQQKIGLKKALNLYMAHARGLAKKMGILDNFQVLVVGDSPSILEVLGNMSGIPKWFHRPQTYHEVAHPLVYGNLLSNNGGGRCRLDWFSEPIIDLHLLASSAAMLTSMHSTFYRVAEMVHVLNNRPVCHCAQNAATPEACQCIGEQDTLAMVHENSEMTSSSPSLLSHNDNGVFPKKAMCNSNLDQFNNYTLWGPDGSYVVTNFSGYYLNCTVESKKCIPLMHHDKTKKTTGKWIYLHGDSTVRQLYGALMMYFMDNVTLSFNETKSLVMEQCEAQTHRQKYNPTPAFGTSNCSLNEKTCHWNDSVGTRVTFDWKHFVLEDREEFLFGDQGYFASMTVKDQPDVLVTKLGFHLCAHTRPPTALLNSTQTDVWLNDLPLLVKKIRDSYHGPVLWLTPSTYVWGGNEEHHMHQRNCMKHVRDNVINAVSNQPGMYIVDAAEVEDKFSVLSGNWGMHRPDHIASLVGYHTLALMNCLV